MARTLFDGFCHRDFSENLDGWRDKVSHPSEFHCVETANSIQRLFTELQKAQKRVWKLEQQLRSAGLVPVDTHEIPV